MSTTLRVAELDFDTIKENLKQFLRSKPEFTDYNFEGSGLSVLIDLLAYNTHYNAVIGNMLIQEMFLDTAVKRQSLSLIAKRLGYMPRSYRAPHAVIDVEVFPVDQTPSYVVLGKNTKFTANIDSYNTVSFVTRDSATAYRDTNGRYIFSNVDVYEGDNSVFSYVVDNNVVQQFEIPSKNVDTSLVRVFVQDSTSSSNITEWKNYNSLVDLKSDTKAFFIKLNENLMYEVYFGDDVFGKSVTTGNVIIIDYVSTNGPVGNYVSKMACYSDIDGHTTSSTTVTTVAYGGALPETTDEIRTNAQNAVLAQNRAVTESDYVGIIEKIIPVQTVAVYGGETMTPPQYGKVFISIKQNNTTAPLSIYQKTLIDTELKKRSMLSTVNEFVDPTYTYLVINTKVKYDTTKTASQPSSIITKTNDAITSYAATNLNRFNSGFEYSKLVSAIDDADVSIISNDTSILLRKEIPMVHGIDYKYVFAFNTEIEQSNSKEMNVISSPVVLADSSSNVAYITDVDGIMQAYYMLNGVRIVIADNVGTIDYTNGTIDINLKTISNGRQHLTFTVEPVNRTVMPKRNDIITLSESDITISIKSV